MMTLKRNSTLITVAVSLTLILFWMTGCEEKCEEVYKKAMELSRAGKYEKAVELFELILTRCPEHSLTWRSRQELSNLYFYKLNQPEKALDYAQKLYEQAPKGKYSMEALLLIGQIQEKALNHCPEAVNAYRLLLQDYAKDVDAGKYQLAIADCFFRGQEYKQALTEYQMLTERYPQSEHVPRAQFQIANSYALMEMCEKAIAIYEQLLPQQNLAAQFTADIKLELAYCYGQQEEFEKALALYTELEHLDPSVVLIDQKLITQKKEYIEKRIKESNRKPREVDWSR